MKRFVALILVIGLICSLNVNLVQAGGVRSNFNIEYDGKVYQYKTKTVTLIVDGKEVVTGDMPAIVIDNRTLVPAREVFESEGIQASVGWNGETQEVYILYADKAIVLKIGSTTAYVNDKPVELDVPAKLIRDTSKQYPKTMIPLRFVIEQLGYTVNWDQETFTAELMSAWYLEELKNAGDDDKLDELSPGKAVRPLPTPLKNNPVYWNASSDTSGSSEEIQTQITEVNSSPVKITAVTYEEQNGIRQFKIQATGPITFAKSSIYNGKYIVDIFNGTYNLDNAYDVYKLTYGNNPITTYVESSQQPNDELGRPVVRVNFTMTNPNSKITLKVSEDRKTLYVRLMEHQLTGVYLGQNEIGDYIILTGDVSPTVESFRLSNPNRIVFDLANMYSLLGFKEQKGIEGQYVTTLRTGQFDANTARVVVETEGQANYSITQTANGTTMIQFSEPTYDNISYESYNRSTIILEGLAQKVNVSSIIHEDRYWDREYILHLPGDYSDILGSGIMPIMDDVIEYVEISNNDAGMTDIRIKAKTILTFKVESALDYILIKAYKPKEVYSQIVVIDIGHGGKDPGAVSGKIYEKDINFAMAGYLKKMLDNNTEIKTYYTRRDDTFISLQERCDIANEIEADFFVSIHNNSYYSQHHGTETIYFADTDVPGLNSIELAQVLQKHLVKEVGLNNRGVKSNNSLYVLRNSHMPAAIVEVGFLSNASDLKKITDPAVQQKAATAIYNAILEVFKTYPTGR